MAKAAATAKKTEEKPAKKATTNKVGVDYLAEKLDLQPFTVRVHLRELGVEKSGRSYEFTKDQADKLVKKIKGVKKSEE